MLQLALPELEIDIYVPLIHSQIELVNRLLAMQSLQTSKFEQFWHVDEGHKLQLYEFLQVSQEFVQASQEFPLKYSETEQFHKQLFVILLVQ